MAPTWKVWWPEDTRRTLYEDRDPRRAACVARARSLAGQRVVLESPDGAEFTWRTRWYPTSCADTVPPELAETPRQRSDVRPY